MTCSALTSCRSRRGVRRGSSEIRLQSTSGNESAGPAHADDVHPLQVLHHQVSDQSVEGGLDLFVGADLVHPRSSPCRLALPQLGPHLLGRRGAWGELPGAQGALRAFEQCPPLVAAVRGHCPRNTPLVGEELLSGGRPWSGPGCSAGSPRRLATDSRAGGSTKTAYRSSPSSAGTTRPSLTSPGTLRARSPSMGCGILTRPGSWTTACPSIWCRESSATSGPRRRWTCTRARPATTTASGTRSTATRAAPGPRDNQCRRVC